jgi:hypothetical protein
MKTSAPDSILVKANPSEREVTAREKFLETFKRCPIPENELLSQLGLFMNRQSLSRLLFMNELYQKIINVHGSIVEFGVRWGQNLSLFSSFRGMYEPFNCNRKILGFDTFSGFPSVSSEDGNDPAVAAGAFAVTTDYENYLNEVLAYHETESPLGHIKKYELIKGDATTTVEKYLHDHPETIIALAFFDFDLYEPTKRCLELIKGHVTKGTVIGFDELNCSYWPGETVAVKEALGLDRYAIRRSPLTPWASYIVID